MLAHLFLVDPPAVAWIDPVLWSLAVEELFYLVAATPAWRGLLARRGAVVAVAAVLTTAAVATGDAAPG